MKTVSSSITHEENTVLFFAGFLNETTGISGGSSRIITVLDIWKGNKIITGGHRANNILKNKFGYNKIKWIDLKLFHSNRGKIFFYIVNFIIGFLIYTPIFIFRSRKNNKVSLLIPSSHFASEIAPLLLYKLFFPRTKLVIYVQLLVHHYRKGRNITDKISILNEKIGLYLSKYAYRIFTLNEFDKNILIRNFGIPASLIYITINSLSDEELKIIEETKISFKKYDFAFTARIHKEKGIFDLIDIIKKIKRKKPDIKCVVIGDGPDKNIFLKKIEQGDLMDNLIYLGYVSDKQKIELLKSSRIFIYPSYADSFPLVLLEVLKCELPIVAYRLPSVESSGVYKNKVNFVEVGNIEDFTKEACKQLQNVEETNPKPDVSLKKWSEIANDEWGKIQ